MPRARGVCFPLDTAPSLGEGDAGSGGGTPWLLLRAAEPLVRAVLAFQTFGFAPLVAAYGRRDLLRGQPVSTTLSEAAEGVAEGVDEHGALRVRCGGLHRIVGGEVSVRLRGEAD